MMGADWFRAEGVTAGVAGVAVAAGVAGVVELV